MHGCIAIVMNLVIVFAGIVNFAPDSYFYTFAHPLPPPHDEILAMSLRFRTASPHSISVKVFCTFRMLKRF